jgi:outer membrane protein TolC
MKFVTIILINFCLFLGAQAATEDSARILPYSTVLDLVVNNHPIYKASGLIIKKANAQKLAARGSFDPKISYDEIQKNLASKQYYKLQHAGLSLFTLSPIKVEGGFERATGTDLNPESVTGPDGLTYAGVSISLLKNALTDARRTYLRQAALMQEQSGYLNQLAVNELIAEVTSDYVNWQYAWLEIDVYSRALITTQVRLAALREEVALGSRAEIDTLESYILLTSYQAALNESRLLRIKSALKLSEHLWVDENNFLTLSPELRPENGSIQGIDSLIQVLGTQWTQENFNNSHPMVQAMLIDVDVSAYETRLKKQEILPSLDLKYQPLSKGFTGFQEANDNKFGLSFSTSLFLRKERGEYQKALYNQESVSLKTQQKSRELYLKTSALSEQLDIYAQNYIQYQNLTQGYFTLFQAEIERFQAGESNVFQINTRQMRFIDSELKQIQYSLKLQQTKIDYLFTLGQLFRIAM